MTTERERETSNFKGGLAGITLLSFLVGTVLMISSSGLNTAFVIGLGMMIFVVIVLVIALIWAIAGKMSNFVEEKL